MRDYGGGISFAFSTSENNRIQTMMSINATRTHTHTCDSPENFVHAFLTKTPFPDAMPCDAVGSAGQPRKSPFAYFTSLPFPSLPMHVPSIREPGRTVKNHDWKK